MNRYFKRLIYARNLFLILFLLFCNILSDIQLYAQNSNEFNEELHARQMHEQINYMIFAPAKRDTNGQLLPLQSYGETIKRAMNFFVNMDSWFKGDPKTLLDENGIKRPVYFYYSNLAYNGEVFRECVDSYVSYPAFHHALFIETFLAYYIYSGDKENLQYAKDLADWNIAHSTPVSDPYGGMPYSTFNKGKPGGFVDGTAIMTDKAAVMALAYLKLFNIIGVKKYFDASYTIAKKLAENQLPEGNWPFRVNPETKAVKEQYTSSIIYAIKLFEAIDETEGEKTFQKNRDRAFGWLIKNPVETMKWSGYYEDIPEKTDNRTNWDCIDVARYLVAHRNEKPDYLGKALKLNAYLTDSIITNGKTFISKEHQYFPAEGVREQKVCFTPMCGHSAHWASLMAVLYNATGEEQYRRRAVQTMNYVTYHLQPNGSMLLSVNYELELYQLWFSNQASSVLFLMDLLGNFPDLAASGESHMLSHTSMVNNISYNQNDISYKTIGKSSDVLKIAFIPKTVTINGKLLPVKDINSNAGWNFDPKTNVLHIYHDSGLVVIKEH